MDQNNSKLITGMIIGIVITILVNNIFLDQQSGDADLELEYINEINRKNSEIIDLENHIESLNQEIVTRNGVVIELEQDVDSLVTDYNILLDRYEVLIESVENSFEIRIGNTLTSYYDALRYEFGLSGSTARWYEAEKECHFAAQLALHDLYELYWPDINEIYEEETGENSNEQALAILNEAYEMCNIHWSDTNTTKIAKILTFINENIEYQAEMHDINRAPVETLSLMSGDCDDFSILAAALIKRAGISSAVAFFEKGDEYHAMVLVKLNELEDMEYWFYEDLTSYNLDEGRWIIIEPQNTLTFQDDESLSEWSVYAAAQVDYEKIS